MSRLLFTYLKEKIWNIILVLFIFSIFGIIYYLYGTNMEVFIYATTLCIFIGLIIFFIRFFSFVKKHKLYQEKISLIEYEFNNLPDARTLTESDYQEMVRLLGQKYNELKTAFETDRQDSLDYYTTWVHQIKTPISVMQMMLQSEDTAEHRALSTELFRIEQYVEMVLSYIRLGSNSSDLCFKEFDITYIVRACIRKYAAQFIQKKIKLMYEPADFTVVTDEKWLCFIIEQLLSNAIKYTYNGTVTISADTNGVLSITDTGIGIAAEDLPRIFEKGFTGYNGRADKKATGLGLYLCKSVADKLGIRLEVTSTVSQGSTFSIIFNSQNSNVND